MAYVPSEAEMVQRYRRDRRELLFSILSSSVLKKVVLPPGAVTLDDVDMDLVSVDQVLHCCRKGLPLDLGEAIKQYHEELALPPATSNGGSDIFYLATDPKGSGPPPNRAPPTLRDQAFQLSTSQSQPSQSYFSAESDPLEPASHPVEEDLDTLVDNEEVLEDEEEEVEGLPLRVVHETGEATLCLPTLTTGLTDDDLRETAFEILLASVGAAGGLISPAKERPKEEAEKKKKKLIPRFNRKEPKMLTPPPPQRTPGLAGLLETMRLQLEVSEEMDVMTREALLHSAVQRMGRRMDSLLVPLELLATVSRAEFADKKSYVRWTKRQLNILEEGLINHPQVRLEGVSRLVADLKALLIKFAEAESLPGPSCAAEQAEALKGLREVAVALAERSARGSQPGEVVCHWADGYHLNVSLYQQLLGACFSLDSPGQLVQEVEEIQELLKSTWRILGITQIVHDMLFTWAQFHQFVVTGNEQLLQAVFAQLKRIPPEAQRSAREKAYLRGLTSLVQTAQGPRTLSLQQAVLTPIKEWLDKRLRDYHQHFAEGGKGKMEECLTAAMVAGRLLAEEDDKARDRLSEKAAAAQQCREYITLSINTAYTRCLETAESRPEAQHQHPLVLLAGDVRAILQAEVANYSSVLLRWNPLAVGTVASLLHNLYGHQLKPFLDSVTVLTDDVRQVLPVADSLEVFLEDHLAELPDDGGEAVEALREAVEPYEVGSVSGTLVMRWVNSQLAIMHEWIERSLHTEKWEPLSQQQRHGHSIVEVFRIIEEALEQFFQMSLPMRPNLVRVLTTGIDNCLQLYANKVVAQLGAKDDLLPPAPPLTRYKREVAAKVATAAAKKSKDSRQLEEARIADIEELTTPRLCIRLNSLHFIVTHLDVVEDSVRERWYGRRTSDEQARVNGRKRSMDSDKYPRRPPKGDELVAMFDPVRRVVNIAMDKICDFVGTKVIFWDLREVFLDGLYKVSVKGARMGTVVDVLDPVLGELCDVITEHLRDRVVLALLQASLDGLLRVLLDGGPMRVFHQSDAELVEEDVNMLKDFFIAEGDGLPRGVVENTAAPVQQILNLYSLETPVVIDNFKHASDVLANSSSPGFNTSKGRSATDADTLLRVLCHRADKDASKYLKKQYKLPKTI